MFGSYLRRKHNGNGHSKSVVCDSSALISLAETGLLHFLSELHEDMRGDFIIGDLVKKECIDRPLKMKSHTLPAIRLKLALTKGVIKFGNTPNILKITKDVMWIANNMFFIDEKPVKLLHDGESEALALALELDLDNMLIDERTTRVLIEDPEGLKKHIEGEFRKPVKVNGQFLRKFGELFGGMRLFRSSEIIAVAYEKGLFEEYDALEMQAVEAALYGIKFAGCSISFNEIEHYTKQLKG